MLITERELYFLITKFSGHGYAISAPHQLSVPQLRYSVECNYLEDNFLTCLKEKALKDQVPEMKCKVEQVIAHQSRSFGSIWNALTSTRTIAIPSSCAASSQASKKAREQTVQPTFASDLPINTHNFYSTHFETQ